VTARISISKHFRFNREILYCRMWFWHKQFRLDICLNYLAT
jgi:hypothetical protein